MELRVLRYFLVVAREENITRAAKLLHITQPTLSRQIMQLEEEFGVTLFRRSKHSIVLTEEGLMLRRRAQEFMDLAEKTEREITRKDEVISGEISIGCGETVSLEFVTHVMKQFQQRYPEVQFALYTGIANDVKERIEGGLLDFGILIEPVDISRYQFVRLPEKDYWTVLLRTDHALAQKERITAADLVGERLILPSRLAIKTQLENWLGPYAEQIQVGATLNLSAYNKEILVRHGMGLAIGTHFETAFSELCMRPMEPPLVSGTILVWKKNQHISPLLKRFIQSVQDAVTV